MKLVDYLEQKQLSQADFGRSLVPPVSQGLVSQWVMGVTRISLSRAIEIRNKTKNAVTIEDCAAMYTQPSETTRRPSKPQPARAA